MSSRAGWRAASFAALGALALAAFFASGNHALPRYGVVRVPREELAYLYWYLAWGAAAVAAWAACFHTWLAARVLALWQRIVENGPAVMVLAASLTFVGVVALRHFVLLSQPIADDELAYELSARNLALGRLSSVPPIDAAFLKNQFVVVDAQHWHGKYPIGHSLLLAPFCLLGRPDLLGALLAVGSLALTYALGRRLVGERIALLAALLTAASPHFLFMHATLLSQTSSTFLVLLATFLSLRFRESQARGLLVGSGAVLGFLLVTRPMPGALVALVLAVDMITDSHRRGGVKRAFVDTLCWGLPALAFAALLPCVNYVQFGTPWTSGYTEMGEGYGVLNSATEIANSLGGALARENVWMLGWPCALLLLFLARVPGLVWGILCTGVAYRVLIPKSAVATTGPVYMTEMVPWLCIGVASAGWHARELLARVRSDASELVAAFALASFAVAACAFWPLQTRSIHASASVRDRVVAQLRDDDISRAVVFGDLFAPPTGGLTWAYFPPNPWPDLRDDILFLRLPAGPRARERAADLWRERFADRTPLELVVSEGGSGIVPLLRQDVAQP